MSYVGYISEYKSSLKKDNSKRQRLHVHFSYFHSETNNYYRIIICLSHKIVVAFRYYYKPYITQYTALTISTTKQVHPHTLCGMVDLWKNSDKLSCKWGGEHTNNNRTFVTVSREMLRNETEQNKNVCQFAFSQTKHRSNHNHDTSFIISNSQNPASQITFLSLERSSMSFEAINNNVYSTGVSIFLITTLLNRIQYHSQLNQCPIGM